MVMSNCDNEYKLFEYVENELSTSERNEIEQHIKECDSCRKAVENFTSIKSTVFRFYDQVDLNQPKKPIKSEIIISEHQKNSVRRYIILAAFFVLSFAYVLFKPSDDKTSLNVNPAHAAYSQGIDDSRWHLDVTLLENKIESIRAEIENINNNKNVIEL